MTVTFDVIYLDNNDLDFERFENSLPSVRNRLQGAFCEDHSEHAHEFLQNLKIDIRNIRCRNLEEFKKRILDASEMKNDISNLSFLVSKWKVPVNSEDSKEINLNHAPTGGESFCDWLKKHIPALLIIVLGDESLPTDTARLGNIEGMSADLLKNSEDFARAISGRLKKHWVAPFWKKLRKYSLDRRDSWHTPGHNGGNSFLRSIFLRPFHEAFAPTGKAPITFTADLSVSVRELGDISEPLAERNPMADAMNRAAKYFGAEDTLFATNGTSTSNKVMLMALLRPGETVLLDRNCHKSVHQAVVTSGAFPVYLSPPFHDDLGIWLPLSLDHLNVFCSDQEFLDTLQPRMLVLTTCTYEGILYPVQEIAETCYQKGILLYSDEAWFPYGRFHPAYGPGPSKGRYNALGSGYSNVEGAHFAVQSAHKALSSFSQASMIHVGRPVKCCFEEDNQAFNWLKARFYNYSGFLNHLVEVARYWHSTSPNYPIIASLDCATTQVAAEGFKICSQQIKLARDLDEVARRLNCHLDMRRLLGNSRGYDLYKKDPLKFMISIRPGPDYGRSHFDAIRDLLMGNEIAWEKASRGGDTKDPLSGGTFLFLITFGSNPWQAHKLIDTLNKGKHHLGWYGDDEATSQITDRHLNGQIQVLPIDAHYANGEWIPLKDAEERVSCQMVVPYPPGIPTILPGLRIPREEPEKILKLLKTGSEIHGLMNENGHPCIRVLLPMEIDQIQERYSESTLEKIEFINHRESIFSATT